MPDASDCRSLGFCDIIRDQNFPIITVPFYVAAGAPEEIRTPSLFVSDEAALNSKCVSYTFVFEPILMEVPDFLNSRSFPLSPPVFLDITRLGQQGR
jgi:hypothetical protein